MAFSTLANCGYSQNGIVEGSVFDENGLPIPYALLSIQEANRGTYTDTLGNYQLSNIPPGSYKLGVSVLGFKRHEKIIIVESGKVQTVDFRLTRDYTQLGEVVIAGKSKADEIRESGYSVDVIETEEQKNLSTDINQVLKNTSGIQIRESGGLGSGFNLSLNGLSGNQIRYFIDGIPMENFGSALTLNNYPINLIEQIEIYKGVVPVSLGADALGGAVNITTVNNRKTFLDAAYTSGSFNTHRASVNGQYANKKHNYFLRLSSFFNHSDNNYRMDSVPVFDLELGNNLGSISSRRFHNEYTSGMVNFEAGILDKKYADKWSIGVTGAYNNKNYQHPDNNLNRAFGAFSTANNTLIASTKYEKWIGNLRLKGYVNGGKIEERIIDTSSLKYNWLGESITRNFNDPKGELFERRSLLRLKDMVFRSNFSGEYFINKRHELYLNLTQNHLTRTGQDEVDEFNQSFESPNYVQKNLIGLAYTYRTKNDKVEGTIFGKQYWYSGKIITQDYSDNELISEPSFSKTGYGAVITWKAFNKFQVKSSFEKAYRIPESFEILGDGIYVRPNPELQPEISNNANVGIRYKKQIKKVDLALESNLFYRSSKDFIRYNPLGPFGEYENLNNVTTTGIEGSARINYNEFLILTSNITYQNLRDQSKFDEGLPNTNYKSRIPNIPYLFGNTRLGISPLKKSSNNKLITYWGMRYVHDFFLTWADLGNPSSKNIIPRQLTHNLEIEYAMKEGRYNLSLAIINLTNATVFDNFNIQKPGRALYFKMRYFLT